MLNINEGYQTMTKKLNEQHQENKDAALPRYAYAPAAVSA
jgi:hypothetical protein